MDASLIDTLVAAWPLLWQGLQMTVYVSVVSLVVARPLGIVTCLMNLSKFRVLRGIAKFYIWIIRGTPMLVQGFYLYFAVPQLMQATIAPDFRLDIITASILTLILNAGAYSAEIFRGAIQSVPKGQTEASRSSFSSKSITMLNTLRRQAGLICRQSLANRCCFTLKDSTIMYALGLPEIMNQAKVYVGRTMDSFATYTWVAIIFLVITSVLMIVSSQLEKRMRK